MPEDFVLILDATHKGASFIINNSSLLYGIESSFDLIHSFLVWSSDSLS